MLDQVEEQVMVDLIKRFGDYSFPLRNSELMDLVQMYANQTKLKVPDT